ncbi:MAG: hypothetical protein IT509_12105 [Rhodocyclaceae bacterium]|nr:hypothetical protein [Rhodocyclaceae bacterium]
MTALKVLDTAKRQSVHPCGASAWSTLRGKLYIYNIQFILTIIAQAFMLS